MMRVLRRLLCATIGHEYFLIRRLSRGSRKVGCRRCGLVWGMHDDTQSFVLWDSDLESLYAPGGVLSE
jgi:hypothetical protein